jgi:ParB family chromosome partitioning protein
MASFNQGMRAHVAGSMNDRAVHGEPALSMAGPRPSLQRQGEGRRRLEAACEIRLDRIIPDPSQPRTEFDEDGLRQLAESLKSRGQLQPIRVRWDDAADRYVVVVGERRFRAAGLAGMETIACVVSGANASPEDLLEDQLVENAIRLDLRPIEQALAYKRLIEARGLSHRQLAERLQIGHASIVRSLALLNLPEPIRDSVEAGQIAPNTAYELSKVDDPAEQAVLAKEAAEGRLKRDDVQERTRSARSVKGRGAKPKPRKTTATLRSSNGAKVTIEHRRGVDDALIASVLKELLEQIEARGESRGEAA